MSLKRLAIGGVALAMTASFAYAEPIYMFRIGSYGLSGNKAASAPLEIGNRTPSTVTAGQNISHTFSGSGGRQPYRWSAPGGTPAGVTINANTGLLSGSVSSPGTYNYVIRLTDADGNFVDEQVSQVVNAPDPVVVSMVSGGTPITLSSQIQASIWADPDVPKVINLPSGVIRGTSNSAVAAVSIGSQWAGSLTFNIYGEIQGAGGLSDGGKGGDALNINTTGLYGEKIVINRFGLIRAGGGGGGRGGDGGKGGDGDDNGTLTIGGAGAIGGYGGGGYGYTPGQYPPFSGILGQNGKTGGLNAGRGGWSGTGGQGGNWGASGQKGGDGQRGDNGNHPISGTGLPGTLGSPGGLPGIAIVNSSDAIIN